MSTEWHCMWGTPFSERTYPYFSKQFIIKSFKSLTCRVKATSACTWSWEGTVGIGIEDDGSGKEGGEWGLALRWLLLLSPLFRGVVPPFSDTGCCVPRSAFCWWLNGVQFSLSWWRASTCLSSASTVLGLAFFAPRRLGDGDDEGVADSPPLDFDKAAEDDGDEGGST